MTKNPTISEELENYVSRVITCETPVQKALREKTASMPQSVMLTTPDQAAFLSMLVKITNAKKIIEIGTYTGHSALAMASALPLGGKLIACDRNQDWTNVAKKFWKEAGVDNRIELILGEAVETLDNLLNNGHTESFDMAFIDADKANYENYYEACLKLVRKGGIIVFDNMLWKGLVIDESNQDIDTNAIRSMNLKLRDDERVDSCLLTIADGIMLVRKK